MLNLTGEIFMVGSRERGPMVARRGLWSGQGHSGWGRSPMVERGPYKNMGTTLALL